MDHTDDYSQTQIPNVFVEPVQQEDTARPANAGVSRARFAVVSLILLGALVASTTGLLIIRNAEQGEWARIQQKLEAERTTALDRASRLDVANTQLSAELERSSAKVEKYGAIEYQLNLIREKTQQIQDLRSGKPSYPHNLYMDIAAVPEWSAPGEKLLKEFVARLDGERARLIAFKEPKPASSGPATPQITSAQKQPVERN
jgi:hypothetical protein